MILLIYLAHKLYQKLYKGINTFGYMDKQLLTLFCFTVQIISREFLLQKKH